MRFNLDVPGGGEPGDAIDFSGRVSGDAIEGTVTVGEGAGQRVMPWKAKQTARGETQHGRDGRRPGGRRQ